MTPYQMNEALIAAVEENRADDVRYSIQKGADSNIQNKYGQTMIMVAAMRGYENIVDTILETPGASGQINKSMALTEELVTKKEYSEGYYSNGDPYIGDSMVDKDEYFNEIAKMEGMTALMLAAAEGHANIVKKLLENGADPNAKNKDGLAAFDLATENGKSNVIGTFNKWQKEQKSYQEAFSKPIKSGLSNLEISKILGANPPPKIKSVQQEQQVAKQEKTAEEESTPTLGMN
jgi:ankyrin repeat protein